ncbi:TonB family protein [Haliangium sp.]|uniref:TonB family protein n=1 Tax=Haliangium sp. TaxID=2663208 RepID=UPI003D0F11AC
MSATRLPPALLTTLALALAPATARAQAQEVPPASGPEGATAAPAPAGPTPGPSPAQPDVSSPAPTQPAPTQIDRPRLLQDAQPRYPADAWEAQLEADVVLLLTVDAEGRVEEVGVDTPAGHGFDEEAVRAARMLRFSPARVAGVPTPIQIRYTFRFRIPEKETVARTLREGCADASCPVDEREAVKIRAAVYERGRGRPLAGVEVYVLDRDQVLLTDEAGQFELEGPPGAYALVIRPPGFYPFEATERLEEGEEVTLKYYVRRHRRSRYSTIVWGSEGRAEVARTSLADDEIRTIPGTLGDPIRVAMLLPGVASSASGLGYPIVRGSLPGDSMYEIDGIPVPMLYHLLFGNAVVHGRFVDEITFQPGGYSAEHGRFPGGRIAATTAKADEPRWVADLSLIETSLFRAQPVGESTEVVAAARYGTLGYIIEGLSANTVFRYWDYQTRVAHRFGDGGKLSLTVLGAQDAVGEEDPESGDESVLRLGFHSADLRYRRAQGSLWLTAGVQGGYEFFLPPPPEVDDGDGEMMGDAGRATMWRLRPYLQGGWEPMRGLEVEVGGDALVQDFGLDLGDDLDEVDTDVDSGLTLGFWTAAEWQLGPVLLNPSLRLDHYRYQGSNRSDHETSLQPRMAASWQVHQRASLKASAGLYTGPSRFSFVEPPIVFGPIPAYEGPGLAFGLSRTWQAQTGVEVRLPGDFEVALTGFYHDLFQAIDFSLINKPLRPDLTPCDGDEATDDTLPRDIDGRSYGAELLVRRRLGNAVFGWVSYALSRSERSIPGVGTLPFDFDQTHVLNTVLSWEVGRNWTLGVVLHVNTGRPYTPLVVDRCQDEFSAPYFEGRRGPPNAARLPAYWRIDARIQKREVFDTWYFDFYVDFFNASFQWETIGYSVDAETGRQERDYVPLFLPLIGVRGEF